MLLSALLLFLSAGIQARELQNWDDHGHDFEHDDHGHDLYGHDQGFNGHQNFGSNNNYGNIRNQGFNGDKRYPGGAYNLPSSGQGRYYPSGGRGFSGSNSQATATASAVSGSGGFHPNLFDPLATLVGLGGGGGGGGSQCVATASASSGSNGITPMGVSGSGATAPATPALMTATTSAAFPDDLAAAATA
ncbi:MAG: hypothetical protein WDW38_000339 [Sanguina aurantia]